MKIDPFRNRTLTSPLAGVTFDKVDEAAINTMSQSLMALPDSALLVMRDGLAREILYLTDLGDWTSGEAEQIRLERLKMAFLTFQATYATHSYVRTMKGSQPADKCTHRCMEGNNCGGCGCVGCGYTA